MTHAPSKLAQLRELSVVVADTGDYEAIKRLRDQGLSVSDAIERLVIERASQ